MAISPRVTKLVNVGLFNPAIVLDIRYATSQNFLAFPLYPLAACYVHVDLISPLNAIQKELEGMGLCLKIYDGYRPLSLQQQMWNKIRDERYVSNPEKFKGAHTRGVAVDVTLIDSLGNELEMPCPFDEFSERAHLDFMETSNEAIENRECLQMMMKKHGFIGIDSEWWHFHVEDWKNEERYPALDIAFEEL
jgi:zinc D-Ala-D-Ala dipeptidase